MPQTLALGSEHAVKLDQALDRVLDGMRSRPGLPRSLSQQPRKPAPDGEAVTENPVMLTIDHPLTGQPFDLEFDRDVLAAAIRFLSYSAETQALLPLSDTRSGDDR